MPLQITTTPAQIGINRTPGKLEINNPAPVIQMQTTKAQLNIQSEQPQIQIDQTQAFSEAGNKTIMALSRENAQMSKQKAMETIAKTARQGRQLADVQNKANPIPSQAEENAFTQFNHEFGMGTIPRSGPDISLQRGRVNISYQPGEVNISVQNTPVSYNYTKSKIEVYLKQKNAIQFQYIDEKI